MVLSELAAATLIVVCGLKRSYRIVLRGERLVRRQINLPAPIIEGRDSFPRFVFRRIFRAGLGIANKWEGRAKTAAQLARERASRAGQMYAAAKDRAVEARARARTARAKKIDTQASDSGKDTDNVRVQSSTRSGRAQSIAPPSDTDTGTLKMVHTRFPNW